VTAGDSTQVINLTEASDSTPANDDSIFIEFGTTNQGKTFRYDSATESFIEAQEKTGVNQQPLFALFDDEHVAFDDETKYPNSSFAGANIFAFGKKSKYN